LNLEEVSHRRENGLQGQKHPAQGIALWLMRRTVRPVRAKALHPTNAFALTGRVFKTDNLSATKK